ncbi:unnamed protein product [Cuscuta campestris]|uniref:Uncharacterized protein n=1 Tax=Cuscuta campestris TaxID=132261 RepID=A0A484MKU3_9ASTE|nr:unnamed protein product [Cuscuta campestris]
MIRRRAWKIQGEKREKNPLKGKNFWAMSPYLWHKIAAISGVAALGLGTYGAHGFKPKNPTYKELASVANSLTLPSGSHSSPSCFSHYQTPTHFWRAFNCWDCCIFRNVLYSCIS